MTTWPCGWNAATNRCMRFYCQKSGPCEGHVEPVRAITARWSRRLIAEAVAGFVGIGVFVGCLAVVLS